MQQLKDLCWVAGVAGDEVAFREAFDRIRAINATAHTYLSKIRLEKWTMVYDGGHRYGTTTTNHVETFNGVLKGARRLPICAIVEMTFTKITTYFIEKLELARQQKIDGRPWTMYADNIYTKNATFAGRNIVQMVNMDDLSATVYNVGRDGTRVNRYAVNLSTTECSCGYWKRLGIPCSHVIQVCKEATVPASRFIKWFFEIDHFLQTYSGKFYPIWAKEYWPAAPFKLVYNPAMREKKGRGRDTTTRIQNEMDEPETRAQQQYQAQERQAGVGPSRRC